MPSFGGGGAPSPPVVSYRVKLRKFFTQAVNDNQQAIVTWDQKAYDVGGWWAGAGNNRLVVPDGVSIVQVKFMLGWANNGAGARDHAIIMNGADLTPMCRSRQAPLLAASGVNDLFYVMSGPIAVVPGDYFEGWAYQNSGAPLNCCPIVDRASFEAWALA